MNGNSMNMWKRAAGLMRPLFLTMLMMPLIGCVTVQSAAICEGTIRSRDNLNRALLKDGGRESRIAGATLIGQLDAGCRDANATN